MVRKISLELGIFFLGILEIEPRSLQMLGKHSSTKLYPQPCFYLLFWDKSLTELTRLALNF